jgi:hypothetical protein
LSAVNKIETLDDLYLTVEGFLEDIDDEFSDMMATLEEEGDAEGETKMFLSTAKALIRHLNDLITEIETKDTDEIPF